MNVPILALAIVLLVSGCERPDYDSPIVDQGGPVVDIAKLPDIEQTTAQMTDLMERISREVGRLVPASQPWRWHRDQQGFGCTQDSTGHRGVKRYLRNLVSDHGFSDAEWEIVFPVVRDMAFEAGLTEIAAPQNAPGNHDMRFSSDDGRVLMFGSRKASSMAGTIACRLSAA